MPVHNSITNCKECDFAGTAISFPIVNKLDNLCSEPEKKKVINQQEKYSKRLKKMLSSPTEEKPLSTVFKAPSNLDFQSVLDFVF